MYLYMIFIYEWRVLIFQMWNGYNQFMKFCGHKWELTSELMNNISAAPH